jgi:hypothetical protein
MPKVAGTKKGAPPTRNAFKYWSLELKIQGTLNHLGHGTGSQTILSSGPRLHFSQTLSETTPPAGCLPIAVAPAEAGAKSIAKAAAKTAVITDKILILLSIYESFLSVIHLHISIIGGKRNGLFFP